ncbi:MAG: ABC transporter substrate-binding protein [Alphaproteobacteria bacterium]
MRKTLISTIAASMALLGGSAMAADSITLQLKWVAQAQFAGYFAAKDKGFYAEEDLDVTIKPGGPDSAPEQIIAGGGADVIVDWMAAALAAREKGVKLVNIAQPFKRSGLMMICPKETGITSTDDFKGRTLGVWFFGNEYPFFAWMNKLGIGIDGGSDGVTVIKQTFDIQPMIQGQADCISVMTYNEYGQALDAGYGPDNLTIFNYTDLGNDLLEDGLYALEDDLADPAFFDKMVRFVRASMKGWSYVEDNPEEGAQIVLDNDETGAQTLEHQIYMAGEVGKLMAGANGVLDIAAYERTAKAVLDQGIIENEPVGAYTLDVTTAAGLQ